MGDTIEADEAVLEIATDKVDSEVPSEVDGVLIEKLFDVDDVVQVGQTIAVIEIEAEGTDSSSTSDTVELAPKPAATEVPEPPAAKAVAETVVTAKAAVAPAITSNGDRFYSRL